MFDLYLFEKNEKYNIFKKEDLNIRKGLCKPMLIQKLRWFLLLATYFSYTYLINNEKIAKLGFIFIIVTLICQFFVVLQKSMYLYKLKIELDNDGKKALYSKFIFIKWVTLLFNIAAIICIMGHLEGIEFCTDLLIILISVNIIRLIFRLGVNKLRLFMVRAALDNIIEESEENGYDTINLNECLDGAEELEVLFGSRYLAIVTELRNLLTKLEEVTIKERSSIYSKSQLVTNLSHDLKTPLTSIINSIYFLKNEELNEDEKLEQINILKEKSGRLKSLIDNLNEVINSEEDEIVLNREYINIYDLLNSCTDSFKERIEEANLDLQIKTQETNLIVYMDKDKIVRVFENLLSNIIKYSLEDTRVYINFIKEDDIIKIDFKNICKYELEVNKGSLGSRFVKGDKSRNSDGYGLGLSIVKNLIRVQGGKVDIITEGDLFKVSIMLKCN